VTVKDYIGDAHRGMFAIRGREVVHRLICR
jgi:hypothetical protein